MTTHVDTKPHKEEDNTSMEEDVGAGIGVLAGAAVGALAGPIGMVVGATLGSIVGDVAGAAIHDEASKDEAHPNAVAPLRAQHDALEGLTNQVCTALTEGDRDDVTATIAQLQAGVLAHLDGEERDLLPGYAEVAPDEARVILAEHALLRTSLAELELGADLHTVRTAAVREFLERLRAHAARENRGMYAWVEARPKPPQAS